MMPHHYSRFWDNERCQVLRKLATDATVGRLYFRIPGASSRLSRWQRKINCCCACNWMTCEISTCWCSAAGNSSTWMLTQLPLPLCCLLILYSHHSYLYALGYAYQERSTVLNWPCVPSWASKSQWQVQGRLLDDW